MEPNPFQEANSQIVGAQDETNEENLNQNNALQAPEETKNNFSQPSSYHERNSNGLESNLFQEANSILGAQDEIDDENLNQNNALQAPEETKDNSREPSSHHRRN